MIAETFAQDLRIGLRVLAKDKSFCALSVFVLALGICAVTTMFTTVNATIIRGFSFPNSDRMTNVTFVDPTTVRMLGPFNNRNVDETGFYVPFYSLAFGPAARAS